MLVIWNRTPKRYQTIFELSPAEFKKLADPLSSNKLQNVKLKFDDIKRKAQEAADEINPFRYEEFERLFIFNNPNFIQRKYISDTVNAFLQQNHEFDYSPYHKRFKFLTEPLPHVGTIANTFCHYMKNLIAEGRLGTAIAIHNAYRSLLKFRGNVRFADVTVSWLLQYESAVTRGGLSRTTVGMYIRALRTIFNEAAANGIIKKEKCYPFGRRKYIIPNSRNIKKALNIEQIEKIFNYQGENESEERARKYWIFFYLCNGINPKDVALLKYKNIEDGYLVFERAKTVRTGRTDPKIISVYITEDIQDIMDTLGNEDKSSDNYIFPILKPGMDILKEHEATHLFIAFVNNWMAEIGKKLNLPRKPSTIISRHSFSTVMKNAGVSTEYIKEALGHHDIKTTENYLDSFEKSIKKEFAGKLTPFKKKQVAEAV